MEFVMAGAPVEDPVGAVATYIANHERVIAEYDLAERPGGPNEISARDVLQTRITNLRITSSELQYFVDRSFNAPWQLLPEGARLVDADPTVEGGLYDDAEELYRAFYNGRPRGMVPGKIHVILHFKRPTFFPILDGRVRGIYEEMAREVSRSMRDFRRGRQGRLYWAAIRQDLIDGADVLDAVRKELAERDEPASFGAQLSDVRLHDILCWEIVRLR
ncbi:MAG: DUF6308 family protein [Nitriliruptorales bacterium]